MIDLRPQGEALVFLPQIQPGQVAALAAQGFRSIVCNRPDEEDGAVPSAEIEAAARQAGLAFVYQPVQFSRVDGRDGRAFGQALAALPGPVAAYCRTGRRSAALWALAHAPERGADAVLATTRAAGCDLDELRPRLGG